MTRRQVTYLLAGAALLLGVAPSPASADVAASMQSELESAGVPGVSVTVATPAAATAADVSTYDSDPYSLPPSISYENSLSPDPTNPLPVTTVTFGKSTATPLPGMLQSPGIPDWISTDDARMPVWRLQVMLAVRHQVAAGTAMAGAAMEPQFPNRADGSTPDLYLTTPSASEFPAGPFAQTMSTQAAQGAFQSNLPAWAKTASVSVFDWVGGERRAALTIALAPLLTTTQPQDLAAYALDQARSLNQQGANIGSVTVSVVSSLDESPLSTVALDPIWNERFSWRAPTLEPYDSTGDDASAADGAQATADGAQQYAGAVQSGATAPSPSVPPPPAP